MSITVEVVADERLPGVLMRALPLTDFDEVDFQRVYPGGDWQPVRSGVGALTISDEAACYDLDVRPGCRVAYRATNGAGGDQLGVAVVDVPAVYPSTRRGESGWVKPLSRPGLTTRVVFGPPGDVSRQERWSTTAVGDGDHTMWRASGPREWPVTTWWDDRRAMSRFLDALESGLLLVQTDPERNGVWRDDFALAKGVSVKQFHDKVAYLVSCTLVAQPAPPPGPSRLVIPGWTWPEATRGARSLTELAQQYPSRWQLLVAGTRARAT